MRCFYSPTVDGLTKSGLLELPHGYFDWQIVAELRNASSVVSLITSQGSSRVYTRVFLPPCRMWPLGLKPIIELTGKWRHLVQGEDRSGNAPWSVPRFLRSFSGMFPPWLRIVPGLADSEICQVWTEHQNFGSHSYCTYEITFSLPCHPWVPWLVVLSQSFLITCSNCYQLSVAPKIRLFEGKIVEPCWRLK